ncbi:restriction endonuclease fold toxin-2 domain-containing protein [Streptomyces sp. YJ-C3]
MAGDDEAGAEFAKVYKSAAGTTLDKRGSRSGRCGIVPLRLDGARNTPNSPESAYQLRTAGYPERKIPLLLTSQSKFKASDGMRPPEGYMIDSKYVLGQHNDAMTANKEIRGLEIVTNDEDATACWQTLMAQEGVRVPALAPRSLPAFSRHHPVHNRGRRRTGAAN